MKKVFLVTMLVTLMLIFPLPTTARVDIDINISLPPPVSFVEPPELIVLPGTYVYAVPDLDVDIFFHDGWWWRTWDSRWYRSREYNSGWVYYENVPTFYQEIPSDWRHYYRERRWRGHEWQYQRLPHHRVTRYWRDWERDRYWEHKNMWGVPGYRFSAEEEVSVSVDVVLPPPVAFVEPPELVVLPGTYVYAVPDVEVDIFFHGGWWWRSWNSQWYRSREYSSGWVYYENIPAFYREVPSDWRHYFRERRWRGHEWHYQRLPHHRVSRYWRDWERDRYWEHQQTWGVRGLQLRMHPQRSFHKVKTKPSRRSYREVRPSHYRSYYIDSGPRFHPSGKAKHGKPKGGRGNGKSKGHGHGNGKK